MKRQDAIDLLENLVGMVDDNQGSDYDTALKMGIEALQKEPCEDAVSRAAVDEYLSNLLSDYLYDEERERLEQFSAWLWDELPSVTPQQEPCEEREKGECPFYAG